MFFNIFFILLSVFFLLFTFALANVNSDTEEEDEEQARILNELNQKHNEEE